MQHTKRTMIRQHPETQRELPEAIQQTEMSGRTLSEAIPPEQLAVTRIPELFRNPQLHRSLRQNRLPQNPLPPNLLQLQHQRQPRHRRRAMTTAVPETTVPAVVPAALTVEVREAAIPMAEAPEETAVTAAEVTWIWSGHRICCSPARAIAIYILRML